MSSYAALCRYRSLPAENDLRLECERLEPRAMMAGNVTVEVTANNDIVITGDDQSNSVVVMLEQTPSGVTLFTSGEGSTQVQSFGNGDLSSIRDVKVDLGEGNDRIRIEGIDSEISVRSVRILGGTGESDVHLEKLSVARNLQMNGEDSRNELSLNESTVDGNLRLRFGAQRDFAEIVDSTISGRTDARLDDTDGQQQFISIRNSHVSRFGVRGGDGDDVVILDATEVAGSIRLDLGNGDDFVEWLSSHLTSGSMNARLGDGDDTIIDFQFCVVSNGPSSFAGNVKFDLGSGDDLVRMGSAIVPVQFSSRLSVSTGDGADAVRLSDATLLGNSRIRTGDGSDLVAVDNVGSGLANPLRIDTGDGGDTIEIVGLDVVSPLRINGGNGTDELFVLFGTTIDQDQVNNVEQFSFLS